MSLKKTIGKFIPYRLIELGRKIIHVGPRRCHVCGSRIRRLLDSGYGYPVLERLQVVGGLTLRADRCPICHATARERLITFWLTHGGKKFRFEDGIRIAHFAPEKGITKILKDAVPSVYKLLDFEPSRYRHVQGVEQADLSNLSLADESCDLLICNHVIEHVPDVGLALREIFRVLAGNGVAILQVPIALALDEHIELGVDSTPSQRVELVGQDDHLRLFTQGSYLAALEQAGFKVEVFNAFASDQKAASEWHLDTFERLFLATKGQA